MPRISKKESGAIVYRMNEEEMKTFLINAVNYDPDISQLRLKNGWWTATISQEHDGLGNGGYVAEVVWRPNRAIP